MGQQWIVNSEHSLKCFHDHIDQLYADKKHITFTWSTGRKRTQPQNASIHKFCEMLAEALNESGLDMRVVLKPEVEIPWAKESVKKHLWKPIQKSQLGKKSTTELERHEVSQVYETLIRHLGSKFGVYIPFPSKEQNK